MNLKIHNAFVDRVGIFFCLKRNYEIATNYLLLKVGTFVYSDFKVKLILIYCSEFSIDNKLGHSYSRYHQLHTKYFNDKGRQKIPEVQSLSYAYNPHTNYRSMQAETRVHVRTCSTRNVQSKLNARFVVVLPDHFRVQRSRHRSRSVDTLSVIVTIPRSPSISPIFILLLGKVYQ